MSSDEFPSFDGDLDEALVVRLLRKWIRHDLKQADPLPIEMRYVVDYYYAMQDFRIQLASQTRQVSAADEPADLLGRLARFHVILESEVEGQLRRRCEKNPVGAWLLGIRGIGPVITAGLLAHIDVRKAPSASSVWRFAGLDPTAKWNKGQKRPWNARLKQICWHAGECFKRSSQADKLDLEEALYCRLYRERKALVVERNEAGGFAELAARTLAERNIRDRETRAIYEAGKIPAGRLDYMATRYATKVMLSHVWTLLYELEYRRPAPDPWAIAHGGHVHRIPIPCRPWPEGKGPEG